MFVKGIRRNYDKINADESIADEDKIDALLKALGKDYLISSEDRTALMLESRKEGFSASKFAELPIPITS